ncbi:MAG TPA: peptide ABC transporter substrate-binding protein [Candidatus Limnocylindrales bacterium]|nr:peptide ABC transporter substrate-binding protein [Candidatus Limnocylindrales bacterium]
MSLRDRAVIGILSLVLVVLTGAVVAPSFEPSRPISTPTPSSRPVRSYIEGVLGSAASVSPFSARTSVERAIVALVFRGLVRLGPDDTIVGDLAERWEVDPTGTTWTFHLRPDLVWQDGQPITADDVLFTIDALTAPAYTGPGAASWREVTAAAPDPSTVVLTLATPLGGFLEAATQPIAPRHLLGGVAPVDLPDDPFGRHPVGSGSFRVAVLDAGHVMLVPAIPDVVEPDGGVPDAGTPIPTDSLGTPAPSVPGGAPMPYLEGIEFRFFDAAEALVEAFDSGELDGASGLAPADAAALAETAGVRLLRYPSTTLVSVTLNLRPSHPEFRDVAVRRALLAAIDRDAIVRTVLAGSATRADSPIPPTSWAFDAATSAPVDFDPEAARAGLVAAGWKEAESGGWIAKGQSEPLTIELLSPEETANPASFAVAEAVAADWRAIGLTVVHTPLTGTELIGDHLRAGEFSAAVVGMGIGLDPDLYPLLASSQVTASGSNFAGLQDPALDAILVAARAPGTDEARKAAYVALQARLASEVYLLPIAFRDEVVAVRDTLRGPRIRPIGSPGDRFWDVLTWRLADDR